MKIIRIVSIFLMTTCSFWQIRGGETQIVSLPDERWWGAIVALGNQMPYASLTPLYDLAKDNKNNQIAPLLLSSAGRYVWSDHPFSFCMEDGVLKLNSTKEDLAVRVAGTTLKEAYLAASKKHFPPSGRMPEEIFFSKPQYNTWIELMYDQNQRDILRYAENVLSHGFPTGVFMIDDGWQRYYGNFDFRAEAFPDARAMCDRLHEMGFKVMVWISPFITPDTPIYREMNEKGYLLMKADRSRPAIINWWNGMSACLDVTNPDAVDYFVAQLKEAQQKYGIDGFKMDAGDVSYMNEEYAFFDKDADVNVFSEKWASIGLRFSYNELRTTWKLGGRELVQRLGDKNYSWHGVSLLIPNMIAAGLMGYYYTCPDMIGGGQYLDFLDVDSDKFDQELMVRSCQIHAMMPMMQFSIAPWRILSPDNLEICRRFAMLHEKMGTYILELAKQASHTGEPIVRHMEYEFPGQGFVECRDQFMLGSRYLVAPMVTSGTERTVRLPAGKWRDDNGRYFQGPCTLRIEVSIERLPYYERI